jgi:WD40 repeat protein
MPKIGVNKIQTFTGHKDSVYALSPDIDKNNFLSGAGDGMVVRWNLTGKTDGELIARVPNSVYSIHFVAEKQQVLVGHNYDGLHVVDLNSRKEITNLKLTDGAIFDIKMIGNSVIVACGDGSVIKVQLDPLHIDERKKASAMSARTIAVQNDLGHIAMGFSDNFIRIYDQRSFTMLKEFKAHQNSVFTVVYSPDGKYLLSGGRDARLNIWDAGSDYRQENSIIAHMYAINRISYNQDGSLFATCSLDKTIKIWQSDEFRLLKVIDKVRHEGHVTSVNSLMWSAYHDWLIACSDDRTVSVWDINFND